MHAFEFSIPTRIVFGPGTESRTGELAAGLGARRVLLVCGGQSARRSGLLDRVEQSLTQAGLTCRVFAGIHPNPRLFQVREGVQAALEFGADLILAVGGGSVIDAAKAIALLIANPQEDAGCLYEPKDLKALPVIAIPTTCGTGSEVTPNAVLTRHAFKTKKSISYNIYPELALVDGKYLASANGRLLIHTAVDALAHCVESRLHAKANVYNHMFSEYGLSLWGKLAPVLEQIAAGPDAVPSSLSDEDLESFMLASTVAGMAIAQTTTSLPHAISYEITYNHGVPHGKACGIFLAAYMDEYARNNPEYVNRVLSLLGFDSTESFGEYLRRLLGSVAITEEECNLYADNIMANASKLSTYPFPIDREAILRILTCSLDVTA